MADLKMNGKIHIGILTWNGLHHTSTCIDSIQRFTEYPWEMYIRDNASSDNTVQWLESLDDKRISVHFGSTNRGVSGGRNWLLKKMLLNAGPDDLILLLDNDIIVKDGWEKPFIDEFSARPKLGVAGRWAFSMLVHEDRRDILQETTSSSSPADTVQGCMFWIRTDAAKEVGLFDESLGPFWHEDDDFCIRALHSGWDVRRIFTDTVIHNEHGSGVALDTTKIEASRKNQAALAKKWNAMGAIGDYGVPKRLVPEDHAETIESLCAILGRPVIRTELNSALYNASRIMHTNISDTECAALASPASLAVLDMVASSSGKDAELAIKARVRIDSILHARRTQDINALSAAKSKVPAHTALCNPEYWDNSTWSEIARDQFKDGRGIDFHARNEMLWRNTHILYALKSLKKSFVSSVCMVGKFEPLLSLGVSRLSDKTIHYDLESDTAECSAEIVINNSPHLVHTENELLELLSRLNGLSQRGGLIICAISVNINESFTQFVQRNFLSKSGLITAGNIDLSLNDAMLLSSWHHSLTLDSGSCLSRVSDKGIMTTMVMSLRKITDPNQG